MKVSFMAILFLVSSLSLATDVRGTYDPITGDYIPKRDTHIMPKFPNMSQEDITALWVYLNNLCHYPESTSTEGCTQ